MGFFKSKKFIILFILALIGVVLISRSQQTSAQPKTKINLKTAQTVEVKKGNIKKELALTGKISAADFAVLSFQTSGELAWLGVKEGDQVNKWQALASLNKESVKKSFQKEMNDYLTSRWNFEDTQDQYKETKDKYLITPELQRILDRQQFTLNNSVLDYEIANLAVKYATLVSPLKGVVTNIENSISGVNVTPLNFSVTIIDPESIYFKSDVDEEDVKSISEKQKAKITLDSFPDSEISSELTNISFTPVEGETSTIYKIKFTLPLENTGLKYRIGMNGDAKIILDQKNDVLVIPIEGYFEEGDKKFVYLKDPKTAKITKQEIKTGLESDTEIEVTEGLKEGDVVIFNE